MQLNFREYGHHSNPAVFLIHGLLGSSSNLHSFARQLENDYWLFLPDLRNHGKSPHDETMTYESMARDLIQLMDEQDIESAAFVGHSMGAKVAMWLALNHPEKVDRLMSVDMAPVSYEHDFDDVLNAMKSVDLVTLSNRREADEQLAVYLETEGLRQYLLQNLVKDNNAWKWRVNLPVLQSEMDNITGFPDLAGSVFPGTAWFVYGAKSRYVRPDYEPTIYQYFPLAKLRKVEKAGHWLYADQPTTFGELLQSFLRAR
jgi:esterase